MNSHINIMRLTAAFVLAAFAACAAADASMTYDPITGVNTLTSGAEDESLTYDPVTGVYTMVYYNTYDQATPVLQRARFELPTRIDPAIGSKIKDAGNGRTLYRYKISNGTASKQNLYLMQLFVSHAYTESPIVPAGWRGTIVPHNVNDTGSIFTFGQLPRFGGGLKPGQSLGNFSFQSQDLPGVDIARTSGAARRDLGGFPDMGPMMSDTPISKQFSDLMQNNESVRRFAAVPKIRNPVPFSPAVVLANLQKHVKTDMASMQLIDPALLTLIDRGLTQAIAAAQGGNTPSLLHEIKTLRQLLKQEHADVDQDNDGDGDDKEKKPKTPHRQARREGSRLRPEIRREAGERG